MKGFHDYKKSPNCYSSSAVLTVAERGFGFFSNLEMVKKKKEKQFKLGFIHLEGLVL